MDKFVPKNLKRWEMPSHYFGAEWPEYYMSGIAHHRDSGALDRSNFKQMLKALGGESDTVTVVRESHWAVGWVEWIAIHEDDTKALSIADEIMTALEDYPVVNDEAFSEEEQEEANQVWANCYDDERRVKYIREFRDQFEFHGMSDLMACARGKFFNGYASELLC